MTNPDHLRTTPQPFVFVLMPLDPAFGDTYSLGIKPACESAGAYCERVDEQLFEGGILQRIYNQISKADVIVADMTGRNPNVYYEVGYSHALGKKVVLITQSVDDIPFDLKHYPHIVYGGAIRHLKAELERRVAWCLQQPSLQSDPDNVVLEHYLRRRQVHSGDVIEVPLRPDGKAYFRCDLALHNPTNRIFRADGKSLGVILPPSFRMQEHGYEFAEPEEQVYVDLPDGRALHVFTPMKDIVPDAWESVNMTLSYHGDDSLLGAERPLTVRIYAPAGPSDVTVLMKFAIGTDEAPNPALNPTGLRPAG